MRPIDYPGRTLAYLGDAVWSLVVRRWLLDHGETKGKTLQKKTIECVSANAQASFYEALHEAQFFTEQEEEIFRRGRNDNGGAVPHSATTQTYRRSTGFEAIIGFLELEGNRERIDEIWEKVRTLKEEQSCHN